ncbi:MAG: CPBP family intramembrane metalloprotease [Eubacterium sp.]|nr:CPBP family intramembrane metalloprotease [Eubacterium sp.]
MKNVLKQSGKALCYFLTYLICQVIATIGSMMVFGFIEGIKVASQGEAIDQAAVTEQVADQVMGNLGIVLVLNAILALGIYFIVTKIRKHKFTEEVSIKKVSVKTLLLTLLASIGSIGFLNFGMDLIPFPEDLVDAMVEGNAEISGLPFWQSLLVTAILVPITEEIVFRGFVFSRLDKAMPTAVAVIITSILFGVIHGSVLWAFWAGLTGAVFNIVRVQTGSLIPSIIMHMLNNSCSLVLSNFDTDFLDKFTPFIAIAGGVLLVTSIFLMVRDRKNREALEQEDRVEVEVRTVEV